jgi:hypothetical protein
VNYVTGGIVQLTVFEDVISSLERLAAWTGGWLGWDKLGVIVANVAVTRNCLYDSCLDVAWAVHFSHEVIEPEGWWGVSQCNCSLVGVRKHLPLIAPGFECAVFGFFACPGDRGVDNGGFVDRCLCDDVGPFVPYKSLVSWDPSDFDSDIGVRLQDGVDSFPKDDGRELSRVLVGVRYGAHGGLVVSK